MIRLERPRLARFLAGLWLAIAVTAQPGGAAGVESPYRVEGARRVVAFADVHGAFDALTASLRARGIVDRELRQINAILKRRDLSVREYGAAGGMH